MSALATTFKLVSLTFAATAIGTGLQAIVNPVEFSKSFGIPITTIKDGRKPDSTTMSYTSLMGVRQLATGLILLVFARQRQWTEMAIILSILGIVVAGTDGFLLWRAGNRGQAKFHAIPGALIALLSAVFVFTDPHV